MPWGGNGEDPQGWYALLLAGIATAIGALWKGWFSFRRDARDDKRNGTINGGYQDLVQTLRQQLKEERDENKRLEAELAELKRRT